MSSDLSRRSSRQPLNDDATSLTSFPDPAETTSPSLEPLDEPPDAVAGGQLTGVSPPLQPVKEQIVPTAPAHYGLNGLLDDAGPSMFDEQENGVGDPQTLSTASTEALRRIIDHRGAVELVRNLSLLLAERDAHVTALTRLAEEFKVPRERIAETGNRVKQFERRRLSLAGASEDLAPTIRSESSDSAAQASLPDVGRGTIRNLTRMFGGGGKRKDATIRPTPASMKSAATSMKSTASASSSRSNSIVPESTVVRKRTDRPKSIDVLSVNSGESTGWTSTFMNAGAGTIKGISSLATRERRDSRAKEPRGPVEMSTRHDKNQLPPTLLRTESKDPREMAWNKFVLRLNELREEAGEEAQSGEVLGAARWGHEGGNGKQKLDTLTRLVIGGIPMRLRSPIWMELSNTYAIMRPNGYKYYLGTQENEDPQEIDAILKDVPRTLTSKYDYFAEKGHDRLRKVLVAFVNKYPGLGYTQGLNMIAGYLLLAIPDESDAFWVLCNMVDSYFPPDYFSPDTAMSAPIADNVVLRQYVKDLLPKLYDKMSSLEIEPEHTVPLSWFLTAFASVLPESVLLRIWDVWLCVPNSKTFLFNVALTLLAAHAKNLMSCEDQGEYWAYMTSKIRVGEEPDKVNELIRSAFGLRKRLEQVEMRRGLAVKKVRKHASTEALFSPEAQGEEEVEA
ncbi:TBC domain-containing protein [Fulvia fulva]|uniref:TBC domain-containing protein n=1 Tax=Passalora fulva TaxID=5499 RepID=A0A9Q8PF51_PASFU|nr:TBC domain-containing protein [Fulvia fulva]KAK4617734.1 TBC domain-containing protein [Fulvia fulva]KAK4619067.1 TBC domain-containing protein [Fulvia fulva]UJO21328.1 TBC domain-containing protein [Fulvia fulva]WPV18150.1 TBC domain-containing protein [Fulvia fulva]WPV32744.1 TBC domain-containing protein [Fulvia fulva]